MKALVATAAICLALSSANVLAAGKGAAGEVQSQVSQSVVDALASGDLNGALIAMREEKNTPKLLYLMREAARVAALDMGPKPRKALAHKVYQNVAIGYHNLYLFLKSRGIDQKDYLREARRYYHKARGAATVLHKEECDLLEAALLAASGGVKKAQKIFSKVDETMMRGDFESMEYIAAYYAAMGDARSAIGALEGAYRLSPGATLTWLAVGDDFDGIRDDPRFQALMVSWRAKEAERRLVLSVPKTPKPRLQITDETGLFAPQKAMPRYVLKKGRGKTLTWGKKNPAGKKAALGKKKISTSKVKKGKRRR